MSAAIALQILRCLAPPKPELPTTGGVVSDERLENPVPSYSQLTEADHDRIRAELATETAAKIAAVIAPAGVVRVPPHRLIPPGPERGACARCSYPADHPVHR